MSLIPRRKRLFTRPHLWLIHVIGVIVPRRLRADWRQEWEAELRHRELLLEEWERLDWRRKLDLLRRSTSAFWDALLLQPRRLEDEIFQDLRYGTRMLLKSKSFTAVAMLSLALGIGANTAIFTIVNAALWRPTSAERPEELVTAFVGSKEGGRMFGNFSLPDYYDYRDQNKVFSGLMAFSMTSVAWSSSENRNASATERAEVIWGEVVSGNYFEVLGVKPILGRAFLPEEDHAPNKHPVVVLSHSLWQRRYHADPALVGRSVYLNGQPFTVIGIASESFVGTKFTLALDFWVPLMMRSQLVQDDRWRTDRGSTFLQMIGRLKPGVKVAQAEADLNLINQNLGQAYPTTNAGLKVRIVPEREGRASDVFPVLRLSSLAALACVGLVLLVACANVANLMLARASARRHEIGVRLALGAHPWRIVRQLLTESVVLALTGGGLGWLLAYRATEVMQASIPPIPYPVNLNLSPDLRVLEWTLGISLLTGLVFGLFPAWHASRTDLVAALKSVGGDAAGSPRRWGLRHLLVIAQMAVSMVVLVCAGLFLRSLHQVQSADPGFHTENLASLHLDLGLLGYSRAEGKKLYAELVRRIETLPGVSSATVAQVLPMSGDSSSTGPVIAEGQAPPPPNQGMHVRYSAIGERYFETLGTQLLLGRDFTDRDRDGSPQVVIINQEMARRLYGREQDVLGKRFHLVEASSPPLEIVGVAKDGKYANLYEAPRPYLFLPHQQRYYSPEVVLLARAKSARDLQGIAEGMRQEVQKLDGRLPVYGINTAEEHLSYAYWGPRLGAGMALTLGLLALALATVGLYSVISYAVAQRTHEIGVRMALGAQAGDVLRLVIKQGMVLAMVGGAIGLTASLALTRLMKNLLFGVSVTDPATLITIALLLAAVALLACYVPARRATKIAPLAALRCE